MCTGFSIRLSSNMSIIDALIECSEHLQSVQYDSQVSKQDVIDSMLIRVSHIVSKVVCMPSSSVLGLHKWTLLHDLPSEG